MSDERSPRQLPPLMQVVARGLGYLLIILVIFLVAAPLVWGLRQAWGWALG